MSSILVLVTGLNAANSSRNVRIGCALDPPAPSLSPRRSYFVLFGNPHGGGDSVCRLLSRHPELNCTSLDVFNPAPAAAAAAERRRLGFTLEAQRSNPVAFLQRYYASCRTRVCGVLLLPNQLPPALLSRLFPPGCIVSKLLVERNVRMNQAALSEPLSSVPVARRGPRSSKRLRFLSRRQERAPVVRVSAATPTGMSSYPHPVSGSPAMCRVLRY